MQLLPQIGFFKSKVKNNKWVVLNRLNNVYVYLDEASAQMVSQKKYKDLYLKNKEKGKELVQAGILIPDNVDMKRYLEYKMNSEIYDSRRMIVSLTMNYACNMECSYCYQTDLLKRPDKITEDSAKKIVEKFTDLIDIYKTQEMDLIYYGGEPMLNMSGIQTVSNLLNRYAEENGVKVNYSMFSNGSLLTRGKAKLLKKLGLSSMTITVDGNGEIHDARRPYKSGKGSFKDVMHNIANQSDLININLVVNLDSANFNAVEPFLVSLKENGIHDRIRLGFNLIEEQRNQSDDFRCSHDKNIDVMAMENWISIFERAEDMGFDVLPPHQFLTYGICSLIKKGVWAIGPNGDFYKCLAMLDDIRYKVGTYEDSAEYLEMMESQFVTAGDWKSNSCNSCELVRDCTGGCKIKSLDLGKTLEDPYCRYDMIDKAVEASDLLLNI